MCYNKSLFANVKALLKPIVFTLPHGKVYKLHMLGPLFLVTT